MNAYSEQLKSKAASNNFDDRFHAFEAILGEVLKYPEDAPVYEQSLKDLYDRAAIDVDPQGGLDVKELRLRQTASKGVIDMIFVANEKKSPALAHVAEECCNRLQLVYEMAEVARQYAGVGGFELKKLKLADNTPGKPNQDVPATRQVPRMSYN